MNILHGIWNPYEEGLLIWVESDEKFLMLEEASDKIRLHPGILKHTALMSLFFKELSYSIEDANCHYLFLELPSDPLTKNPYPSFYKDPFCTKIVLTRWKIPCVFIPKQEVLDLLLLISQKETSLRLAPSLSYWKSLCYFSLELIDKGSFYPTAEPTESKQSYKSCWKIALHDEFHKKRFTDLALAIPSLCHRYFQMDRVEIIENFIESMVDSFIKKQGIDLFLSDSTDPLQEPLKVWLSKLSRFADQPPSGLLLEKNKLPSSFLSHIQKWSAPCTEITLKKAVSSLTATLEKKFKLLIQLQQPPEGSKVWHLLFSLQASDDPSFILSAEALWKGAVPKELLYTYEDAEDRLLNEIYKATAFFPKLKDTLQERFPTSLPLTTQEAYDFLLQSSLLNDQESITLQLPPWWKESKKIRSHVHIKRSSSRGLMNSESILDYDWKASLGSHSLSEFEFKQLAAAKEPLIQFRGEWITVDQQEIASALSFFKKKKAAPLSLIDAFKLSLAKEEESLLDQPSLIITGEQWFEELVTHLKNPHQINAKQAPSLFKGVLRPYQEKGLTWLSYLTSHSFGACLADDMGLGKTIQIIALLLQQKEQSATHGPHLLVCPLSVLGNWQKELEKFAPSLKIMVHHSSERHSDEEFKHQATAHDMVITTYALAVKDHSELLSVEWQSIILDEAQHIKNGESKQSRAIKSLKGHSRIALTGTPIENRLGELWSLMDFLNRGYLGSEESFNKQFTLPIERHKDETKATMLKNLVQPFILRRVKTDNSIISDLPGKIETKEICYLTKEQASLYQSVLDSMLQAIENAKGIERRGLILSTLMKLKQVCNHPAQILQDNSALAERSGKLARLEELLREILERNEKTLIFTQFATMGKLLHRYLTGLYQGPIPFIHGSVQKKTRDELVEQFQQPDGPPLFILSLKAGGTGLNLTQANHVFHFDRWWNPAVEDQATDRAFRIGQKNIVHVHKFICAGTVEERIDTLIEQKKQLATMVISAGEHWITELSTEELKELFSLSL